MFTIKNYVPFDSVLYTDVYRYYLKIPDSFEFDGSKYQCKSIFSNEKTASFFVYFTGDKYKFKDFSSGYHGDIIDLVKYIILKETSNTPSYKEIISRIEKDLSGFKLSRNIAEITKTEFRVIEEKRQWNKLDAEYWGSYKINSILLEEYEINPIKQYQCISNNKEFTVINNNIYGYYYNKELVAVYQPFRDPKFIKVRTIIFGENQLKYKSPYLLIGASMKDILSIKHLNLNIEMIAPNSENSILKKNKIEELRGKYEKIITCFDNDESGVKWMKEYKKIYNINYCYIHKEKDLAEYIKAKQSTRMLINKIIQSINEK
jgi:phosphoribosylpyrophosphate synthetase